MLKFSPKIRLGKRYAQHLLSKNILVQTYIVCYSELWSTKVAFYQIQHRRQCFQQRRGAHGQRGRGQFFAI